MSVTSSHPSREQVRALLDEAFDIEPDQRRAFLEAHLPAGETLEAALALLGEIEGMGDFLERPLVERPAEFRPPVPARIGPYQVERLLGFGSMGVVYLAEQLSPRRLVAVKVLRLDAASANAAKRFELEGELLARLSHPGIATVYEAGFTDLGAGPQPFLAMEYVDGVPITTYAEEAALSLRERIELVWKVAVSVSNAHEHGVLHRDLKPENVLVRANREPVVLDFGVGYSTASGERLLHLTVTGQVVGTVAYMAPEQARGGRVDERADLFALAAMLYELLTDELPFAVRGRLPHEALRVVADADWTPPSRYDPELAGDLEAILATALASEPVRRYPTVAAFAADLRSWLDGKPIAARTPTWHQNLRGFVRRNKALSIWVPVALLLLGGAISWATFSFFELKREEGVSLLFSDLQLLARLQEEAEELWPTTGAALPAFEEWMRNARALESRLPRHREALAKMAAVGAGADIDQRTTWLTSHGRELVTGLEVFVARGGLLEDMRTREAEAAELGRRTVEDPAAAWSEAARRVAADERFGGLVLAPQEGLYPLGPDPASQLEEFAVWGTGAVPARSAETGLLEPRAEDAVVLVLIPGGESLIGAQADDPAGPNYGPAAAVPPVELGHEGPPFRVRLDPFLIAKYELTQAQWVRAFGFNPSDWEDTTVIKETRVTALHPVESMSWEDASRLLPRLGLTLPTEAQWEVAARAGQPHAYVQGPSFYDLVGFANCMSGDQLRYDLAREFPDDGFYTHSPIGSWKPNPFGLHDTLGNVWEYCLDTYKVDYHELEHRPGDGLVLTEPDGDVSRRGQCMAAMPPALRVDFRGMKRFDGRDTQTGVRPARALVLDALAEANPGEEPTGD